jgi:hypothetical protein
MSNNQGDLQVDTPALTGLNLPSTERHICLFVREPRQFNLALLPLLATLSRASARIVLALDQVENRLTQLLADPLVQKLFTSGRLHTLEAAALYFCEQRFDLTVMHQRLARLTFDPGLAEQPLVVIGEISWAAQQRPGFELAHYEAELDKLLGEQPAISLLVCIYAANYCNGEMALTALQTHPAAVIDGICRAGLSPLPRS